MLIGEVVTKSGLSKDTIRFYEKQGLIKREKRRDNNYKEYTDETLGRLLQIKHIKSFGFTLYETAELVEMIETNSASCTKVLMRVEDKLTIINQKIKELKAVKKVMVKMLAECCESGDQNCPTITLKKGK